VQRRSSRLSHADHLLLPVVCRSLSWWRKSFWSVLAAVTSVTGWRSLPLLQRAQIRSPCGAVAARPCGASGSTRPIAVTLPVARAPLEESRAGVPRAPVPEPRLAVPVRRICGPPSDCGVCRGGGATALRPRCRSGHHSEVECQLNDSYVVRQVAASCRLVQVDPLQSFMLAIRSDKGQHGTSCPGERVDEG
jgi:hypothetical protein